MSAIAKLTALLGMDSSQFKAGVDQVEARAQKLQGRMAAVASGIASVFGIGMAAGFAKNAINFFDNMADTAANLGINIDKLQALTSIAATTGVSFEQLTMALGKLSNAQTEVSSNTKLQAAFERLNISISSIRKMSADQLFSEIGRALNEATNRQAAYNAVVDIFGERIGPRLIQTLKESKSGLDSFNGALPAESIERLKNATDAWKSTIMEIQRAVANLATMFLGMAEAAIKLARGDFAGAWEIAKSSGQPAAELKNSAGAAVTGMTSAESLTYAKQRLLAHKAEIKDKGELLKLDREILAIEAEIAEMNLKEFNERMGETDERSAMIDKQKQKERELSDWKANEAEKNFQSELQQAKKLQDKSEIIGRRENELREKQRGFTPGSSGFLDIQSEINNLMRMRQGISLETMNPVNELVRIGANVRAGANPVEKKVDKQIKIAEQQLKAQQDTVAAVKNISTGRF